MLTRGNGNDACMYWKTEGVNDIELVLPVSYPGCALQKVCNTMGEWSGLCVTVRTKL